MGVTNEIDRRHGAALGLNMIQCPKPRAPPQLERTGSSPSASLTGRDMVKLASGTWYWYLTADN
jgi:hypothetical protein